MMVHQECTGTPKPTKGVQVGQTGTPRTVPGRLAPGEVWGGRVEYTPGEGSEDEGEVGLVSGVLGGGVFCWADGDIREARGREGKAGRKEERKGERARGIISTNSRSTAKRRFTCTHVVILNTSGD